MYHFTKLESEELWLTENEPTQEKKKVTADKNMRFKENSPKQPKNKLCASNAKFAIT